MGEPDGAAYVDGRIVRLPDATVPLADRGFLLGDGVFETLRTSGRRPFRWDLHAARLRHGLETLGIHTDAVAEAEEAVGRLCEASELDDELYLRVQVTRDPGVREPEDATGRVTALARRLVPYPDRVYADGVRLRRASLVKRIDDPLSTVKHLSYLPYLLARREARDAGADDALVFNDAGRVCEGSHSNVLAHADGRLHAPGPEEGALDGVTRRVLLEALQGFEVVGRLDAGDLARASEVLLTNTVGGVVPVSSIDGVACRPKGRTGPFYRRLRSAYAEALAAVASS